MCTAFAGPICVAAVTNISHYYTETAFKSTHVRILLYFVFIYIYMIITHNVMIIAEKHTRGTNRPIYVTVIFYYHDKRSSQEWREKNRCMRLYIVK